MKLSTFLTATTLGLTALTANATTMQGSSNQDVTKVIYVCESNQTLEVVYVNGAKNSYAIISQVDEMIPMELMKTASGEHYKAINPNYTYELLTKGNQASLFGDGKAIISNCVNH
ncbi:lysozyme inhibitor [Pasteurellaceae bacterium Orientalotternb1]|nr:lysozyme inhibitor [Pasteurellaceae bacterium Orientalotternb1]